MSQLSYKKLALNVAGTLFLLFLAGSYVWNYDARQKETETVNKVIGSVLHGKRSLGSVVRGAPERAKQVLKNFY